MSIRRSHNVFVQWVTRAIPVLVLGLLLSCSGASEEGENSSDTLSQRQKDSIVSTLPVPGAGAVGRALDAADAARERARQHDTMG